MRPRLRRVALGALLGAGLVAAGVFGRAFLRNRGRVDYHRDLVPILAQHCAECHRSGGVSPEIRLDERGARALAVPLRQAVAGRTMPPFAADNTGFCGTWREPRWLESEEIATVLRWVDEASEPLAGDAPVSARSSSKTADLRVDRSFDLAELPSSPGSARCTVVDPALDADRFLRAMRVIPADPRGVAQLNLYVVDPENADLEVLEREDTSPGYLCPGSARADRSQLALGWTAADGVARFPEGIGLRLRARSKLVLQVRQEPTNQPVPRGVRVELELAEAAREGRLLRIEAAGSLPARRNDARILATSPALERGGRLVGVTPSIGERGTFLQLKSDGAGGACLATFDHWRPRYQRTFFARVPPQLAAGQRLTVECAYHTHGVYGAIPVGDRLGGEECRATVVVVEGP